MLRRANIFSGKSVFLATYQVLKSACSSRVISFKKYSFEEINLKKGEISLK